MDYFQGVVNEYLRANRATFINTEYLIDLDPDGKFRKGRHWYCDALAINFAERTVYLCETSYSKTLSALLNRLSAWSEHWSDVCAAISRTSNLDQSWTFQPWAFIPESSTNLFRSKLATSLVSGTAMPNPRVETLEAIAPWNYCSWDRQDASEA